MKGAELPSYRVAVDVLGVHPGVAPPEVLPRAEEILAEEHLVEDRSVEITGGRPQVHLRFLVPSGADGDGEAEAAVRGLVRRLSAMAVLGDWALRRGPGRRWRTIRTGRAEEDLPEHPVDF
ncbi:MAG TPA: hypothetical protein H9805_04055 [Candidatus Janibacter merdipullorum]|nr:hypothetical protein [Candidatus Janibacter merdipullorum]